MFVISQISHSTNALLALELIKSKDVRTIRGRVMLKAISRKIET